jgi:hypothetical protein
MQRPHQIRHVFAGVVEVQNPHGQRSVLPQEIFQARSSVGERNLTLGFVPANLRRLPPPLQSQFVQVVKIGQISYLMRVLGRLLFVFATGVEDHGHRRHAPLCFAAAGGLLRHAPVGSRLA